MINWFKNLKSSSIDRTTSVAEVLDIIQNGNENQSMITEAREAYWQDKDEYKRIKEYCLPCYTLNFEFFSERKKTDIKNATGFVYLDVDNETGIDFENELVYASWISLSGNGRGLLVKAEGVTAKNFSATYRQLSEKLNLNTDKHAAKSTQPNILTYDPYIYLNDYSHTWTTSTTIKENKKSTHYTYIKKGEKERKDGSVVGSNGGLMRFNNLADFTKDIDFDGELFKDFSDKIEYSEAYLPYGSIKEGGRNNIIYGFARQLRSLNPYINATRLQSFISYVNHKKCVPPLEVNEITTIVRNVMSINEHELVPLHNKQRRIVFNLDYDLTVTQRRQLSMGVINNERKEKSIQKIRKAIDDWDFKKQGKITQKKLAQKSSLNIKTVQSHYPIFKKEVKQLNAEIKKNK